MFKERWFASKLLKELSEKDAEKISGGAFYTLANQCGAPIENVFFDGNPIQVPPRSEQVFFSSLNQATLKYDEIIGSGSNSVALVIDPGISVFNCTGNQVTFVPSG